jgi:hypothetical protein
MANEELAVMPDVIVEPTAAQLLERVTELESSTPVFDVLLDPALERTLQIAIGRP